MKRIALGLCLVLSACAPREILLPVVGLDPPRFNDLPADFEAPLSAETERPMPGFGGSLDSLDRTPVIFVHGNTVSASYWQPVRAEFITQGYQRGELWGFSYGWNNVRYFDSADLSVPSLERAVTAVMDYIGEQTGTPVRQVDLIGHSLGVTLTRQWMRQTNAFHKVRSFIATCGANDGVWTASRDTRGQQRPVSWELYPGSPWLAQLNRDGETPGPTRYMTLYDGTGWGDVLFPAPYEHSGALEGADNVAWNVEHGSWYGHLNLPREPGPMAAMREWLQAGAEPDRDAEPPQIALDDNILTTDQPGARLHCREDGRYPDRATPARERLTMQPDTLYTCFAHHPATRLASPLARFRAFDEVDLARPRPTVSISPAGGVFEHPIDVTISSNDPEAYIVYNTAGTPLTTGSPLYRDGVHIVAPVTLTAMAVSPGGVRSEPVSVEIDISLELVEARHTLQRQFDPQAPVKYAGQRKKGN